MFVDLERCLFIDSLVLRLKMEGYYLIIVFMLLKIEWVVNIYGDSKILLEKMFYVIVMEYIFYDSVWESVYVFVFL